MAEIELGNLYDINKELMKNEPVLDPILFNRKVKEISTEMLRLCDYQDLHYWMLLCHERRDYTMFNIISSEETDFIEFELGPTLRNRGKILSVDQKEEKAWEIWIRDEHDNENFVYYLFNYDDAVIEINE